MVQRGEVATLEVWSTGATVNVVGRVERQCSRAVYDTIQLRHGKTVGLEVAGGGGGGGNAGAALLLIAGVVILPVSLIVTGIVVATSKDTTETRERPASSVTVPCPDASPNRSFRASLPSGAEVELTTSALGAAQFDVPETEPAYGVVQVRDETSVRSTWYYRDLAACYAHREEVRVTGRWDELPRCGSSREELATDAAWQATARAVRVAAGGRCDLALELAVEASRTDPNVYETVFLPIPALGACLADHERAARAEAERVARAEADHERAVRAEAAAHDACVNARREQMLRAQQLQDLKARTAALRKLPTCAPGR